MPFDHEATRLHREDLDREIETIRQEQVLAPPQSGHPGLIARARRGTGAALIAAGLALAGRDAPSLAARTRPLDSRRV